MVKKSNNGTTEVQPDLTPVATVAETQAIPTATEAPTAPNQTVSQLKAHWAELVNIFKLMKTQRFGDALDAGRLSTRKLWLSVYGAYSVIIALFVTIQISMMVGAGQSAVSSIPFIRTTTAKQIAPPIGLYFQIFFIFLIIAFLIPLLQASALRSTVRFGKAPNAPFKSLLNVVAVSYIPFVLVLAVGLILCSISIWFGIIFSLFASGALLMGTVLRYIGVQKVTQFNKSPLLPFVSAQVLNKIILSFMVFLFIIILSIVLASTAMSGFSNLFGGLI